MIGTFNVESPRPNAFGEDDLQFAETFSRELASALHTLELLSAEKRSAGLTVDRGYQPGGRPARGRNFGCDHHDSRPLHRSRTGDGRQAPQDPRRHRSIKQCIQKVGEDLAPATPATATVKEAHPLLKGLRVLVADSDERVRRSAHGILGRWGCVVETARDAQEALTMARLSTYDAICADIRLPDMSGYDIFKKLRDAQPQAKVILMTAYGYDPSHSIVKAKQEGMTFTLFKPFRIDQLIEALETQAPALPNHNNCLGEW